MPCVSCSLRRSPTVAEMHAHSSPHETPAGARFALKAPRLRREDVLPPVDDDARRLEFLLDQKGPQR